MITGLTRRAFLFVLSRVTQGFGGGGDHFVALINIRRHTSDEFHVNSEVILQLISLSSSRKSTLCCFVFFVRF